jgi:hypothetical protein
MLLEGNSVSTVESTNAPLIWKFHWNKICSVHCFSNNNNIWQFLQKLFAICASEVWPALPEMLIASLVCMQKLPFLAI